MKTNIDLFFEAINKHDLKKISNEWIVVLYEIFPKAVINFEDFLILKEYLKKINNIFIQNNYFSFQYLINSEIYAFVSNNIQKYSSEKIYRLLPKVVNFLESAYQGYGIFNIESIPLEKRIINKKIIEIKKWLDIYFSPRKLIENLHNKNKLSLSDFELIGELNLNEYHDNLIEILYSNNESIERKKFVLKTLFKFKDVKIDDEFKKIVFDNKIDNFLIPDIIDNLLLRNIDDKDFWKSLFNHYNIKDTKIKISYKILALEKKYNSLIYNLRTTTFKESLLILNLIENLNLDLNLMKKLFKYIFDDRNDMIIDNISSLNKNIFLISEKSTNIFLKYFHNNPENIIFFEKYFINYIKKIKNIKTTIFYNFTKILIQVFDVKDFENLLNSIINGIKYRNKRKEILTLLEQFLPFYNFKYDKNLIDKITIIT